MFCAVLLLLCWGAVALTTPDAVVSLNPPVPPVTDGGDVTEVAALPALPEDPARSEARLLPARRPDAPLTIFSFTGTVLDHRGDTIADYVLTPGWSIFT